MKTKICIKKLSGLIVPSPVNGGGPNPQLATSFMASMMQLGFCPSERLATALRGSSFEDLEGLYSTTIPELKKIKGDVTHKPMYPNFPKQVMEASDVELFINAILHYWTSGNWSPKNESLPRELCFEVTKFKELDLVTDDQLEGVLVNLLSSTDSLSSEDKSIVEWFVKDFPSQSVELLVPETIPFKETMCIVAGLYLDKGMDITPFVKTATDVLRIVTYLNEGDVSLATNTKFKSMPRSRRRLFANLLDKVASEEDINRHRSKWTKLFHSLHIGDYSQKLYDMANKIRNNKRILTFNSRIHDAMGLTPSSGWSSNLDGLLSLLMQRPGEFARRLDHTLRLFENDHEFIVDAFSTIVKDIPTKTLTQILGHLKTRGDSQTRIVFPKGVVQHAQIIPPSGEPLSSQIILGLNKVIEDSLVSRFSKMESLGKTYIDPDLQHCPIPSQQRSASEGAFNVARGTRLDIGSDNTLRFFIYWVGQDIDLSATIHDEEFNMIEQISYTNLRSTAYESCHSGDIVRAPDGASEFIDITIDKVVEYGARYVAMNVLVYSGPTFKEHSTCFAGWMTRAKPNDNEIYEPKTVKQKVDLQSNSRNSIPVVFDLIERKAIWCDLSTKRRVNWSSELSTKWHGGNNVHTNSATIEQTLQAIVEANNKVSLFELFSLHVKARGEIVTSKEDADTIFSFEEGTTPYDVNVISSEYLG